MLWIPFTQRSKRRIREEETGGRREETRKEDNGIGKHADSNTYYTVYTTVLWIPFNPLHYPIWTLSSS
jgi:hypothetical protein